MDILAPINDFFRFDFITLMKILFLGNLFYSGFIALFRIGQPDGTVSASRLNRFLVAKLFQTAAWLLTLIGIQRQIPVPIDLGYTLLYIGLFIESRLFLDMSHFNRRWLFIIQDVLFAGIIIGVNVCNIFPVEVPIRIAFTSFSIFSILLIPCVSLVLGSGVTLFKKFIGFSYAILIAVVLIRGLEILLRPFSSLRVDNWLQNVTLVFFMIIMFIGTTGFLLLVKEEADSHIRELAYFDSLTGLLNRRHFLEEAERFFERHSRYEQSMSVLFLDVDHFKRVNDTYGHKFGDRVLKDFSLMVNKSVRSSDLCCRYGGEEFLIMLSNSTEEKAIAVAKRIQSAIRLSGFPPYTEFSYTVSVGIYTAVPSIENGDTLEFFIEKSDLALYRAKNNGRNRVEVYPVLLS
jgi:diguanylate cyclase (GGDEF)-like protein